MLTTDTGIEIEVSQIIKFNAPDPEDAIDQEVKEVTIEENASEGDIEEAIGDVDLTRL